MKYLKGTFKNILLSNYQLQLMNKYLIDLSLINKIKKEFINNMFLNVLTKVKLNRIANYLDYFDQNFVLSPLISQY